MVNGSRYYRAFESVSIASALSSALTIYPCQIRVHQRWQSKLQLIQLGRRSGGRPQRTVYPSRLPVNTVIHTTLAGIEPTTFQLLVRRAASSATDCFDLCMEWMYRVWSRRPACQTGSRESRCHTWSWTLHLAPSVRRRCVLSTLWSSQTLVSCTRPYTQHTHWETARCSVSQRLEMLQTLISDTLQMHIIICINLVTGAWQSRLQDCRPLL